MGANGNSLMPIPPGAPLAPGQDYISVSRRPPDIEDYIDIIRRYWGWIFGPAYAGLVIAVVVGFLWPDTYVSTAVMRITPPQVPERLVPSATDIQMADRINQMQQEILSRTSLSELIQRPTLDLYREDRQQRPLEDVIDKMKRKVSIQLITPRDDRRSGASAFRISFSYHDRHKAQALVRELVTKFTEQNVQVVRAQSSITTGFLLDEMRIAKAEVERLSQELAQFRAANAGRLPEQMGVNMQTLNSLQMQLYSVHEQISRAAGDKLMLETSLQNLKNQFNFLSSSVEETTEQARNERLEQLKRAILDRELGISSMLENYTESHPDIRSRRAEVEVLKRERDALERAHAASTRSGEAPRRINQGVAQSLENIKSNISSIEMQIRTREMEMQARAKQQADLQRRIAEVQARIEASPGNEQRYAQLTQDLSLAKQRYEEMNRKKSLSETATNLEERKGGENLEVLDPASLPETPTEPNRLMFALMGAGGGLALGVVLAGAREVKDTSLKNLKDVRAYTNLPILTSIPLLENGLLVRRKRRLHLLAWATGVLVGLAVMCAAIYYYYFGRA